MALSDLIAFGIALVGLQGTLDGGWLLTRLGDHRMADRRGAGTRSSGFGIAGFLHLIALTAWLHLTTAGSWRDPADHKYASPRLLDARV
jgi:hypothetical protein